MIREPKFLQLCPQTALPFSHLFKSEVNKVWYFQSMTVPHVQSVGNSE